MDDKLKEALDTLRDAYKEADKEMKQLADECPNDVKIAVTAWAIKHIVDHAQEGGSFRTLIYDRFGFGPEAYVPLYSAGGMTITNEFDIEQMDEVKRIVKENKIEALKKVLSMCDEPECFNQVSCGWPTEDGGYRNTCSHHYHGRLVKDR